MIDGWQGRSAEAVLGKHLLCHVEVIRIVGFLRICFGLIGMMKHGRFGRVGKGVNGEFDVMFVNVVF